MWNFYLEDITIAPLMDIVAPLIFFELVKMHCPDCVMWQVDLKQHILPDINTSDQLHSINYSGRHADYTWMTHHLRYILMWDAYRNLIFREVHPIISKEKCMGWYLSITC